MESSTCCPLSTQEAASGDRSNNCMCPDHIQVCINSDLIIWTNKIKASQTILSFQTFPSCCLRLSSANCCTACSSPSLQANRHLNRGEPQNTSSLTRGTAAPWQDCMMTLLYRRDIPNGSRRAGWRSKQQPYLPDTSRRLPLAPRPLSVSTIAQYGHAAACGRSGVVTTIWMGPLATYSGIVHLETPASRS